MLSFNCQVLSVVFVVLDSTFTSLEQVVMLLVWHKVWMFESNESWHLQTIREGLMTRGKVTREEARHKSF